ncbi:hypothetical protein [Bacteroides finegoldii]|uniref:hypothetical protein n=1 Tax=Bacteroides finegoldii TaxID=338188 RepID=UPI001898A96F|nr:hypothetical protein [Bacteroides finegoldii]
MHIPENRCRCENLQSEAKWSLAGSLYGNGLESSTCNQNQSAELCLMSQTWSKPDGTSSPKGRHFRRRMQYDKSEVAANICEPASKTIRWLYFRKRQPAFGRAIEQVIICRYVFQPH